MSDFINVRCNWCYAVHEETSDKQVVKCENCGSDSHLMEMETTNE
jgi:DNA-directed RNA polymerase subunit RPC12/RpoP